MSETVYVVLTGDRVSRFVEGVFSSWELAGARAEECEGRGYDMMTFIYPHEIDKGEVDE